MSGIGRTIKKKLTTFEGEKRKSRKEIRYRGELLREKDLRKRSRRRASGKKKRTSIRLKKKGLKGALSS